MKKGQKVSVLVKGVETIGKVDAIRDTDRGQWIDVNITPDAKLRSNGTRLV
jgi:hypothetical protein